MRTWISRVAVAVLAVSALTGAMAVPASAADGPAVQSGVGISVTDVLSAPISKQDAESILFPNTGPKHEVCPD